MKLPLAFYRLPLRFDATRLQQEVAALPPSAWVSHPTGYAGNSAMRLISVGGGENDGMDGPMLPTPHLERSPYLGQVLASFGVVWSRSRLLELDPWASVPQHADTNYHWFTRERLARYHDLLGSFARDWRQLYARWGEEPNGMPDYRALLERLRNASRAMSDGLVMRPNETAAHFVLEGRVLHAALVPGEPK